LPRSGGQPGPPGAGGARSGPPLGHLRLPRPLRPGLLVGRDGVPEGGLARAGLRTPRRAGRRKGRAAAGP